MAIASVRSENLRSGHYGSRLAISFRESLKCKAPLSWESGAVETSGEAAAAGRMIRRCRWISVAKV